MDNSIRTVLGPDGTHMEQEFGNMRWNLTTGEMSTIIDDPRSPLRAVVRPDGSTALENQVGSLRFSSDNGIETLI